MADFLSGLRASRESKNVPYLRFLNDFDESKKEVVYGFVEASEDISFYNTLILNKLSGVDSKKIDLIPCEGKYAVKKVFDLIDWSCHSKQQICFFRDRDLSDYVSDDKDFLCKENCYVTDYYSIENSIVTKNLFHRMLIEVLGFENDSLADIETEERKFEQAKSTFENELKVVMANIIYWKQKGFESPLDPIKISGFLSFDSTTKTVVYKNDNEKIDYLYSKVKSVDRSKCDVSEINAIIKEVSKGDNYRKIIRGHFLSKFFVDYCNMIKKVSCELSYKNDVKDKIAPRCGRVKSMDVFIEKTYLKHYEKCGMRN